MPENVTETEGRLLAAYVAGWNDGYGRSTSIELPQDEAYVREAGFDDWLASQRAGSSKAEQATHNGSGEGSSPSRRTYMFGERLPGESLEDHLVRMDRLAREHDEG